VCDTAMVATLCSGMHGLCLNLGLLMVMVGEYRWNAERAGRVDAVPSSLYVCLRRHSAREQADETATFGPTAGII
jgi:hypothetical protein